MDEVTRTAKKIFAANDLSRKQLAFLPFEEKIRMVIEMQKRAAEIRPDLNWPVWSLEDTAEKQEKE